MKVLITGGAGFIGSTIGSACVDEGIIPVILDDLSTGREEFTTDRAFYRGDVADAVVLDRILVDHPDLFAVVHCAAKIVVPDSVDSPLEYYESNVAKSIEMLTHLERRGLRRVIFSSSASIYQADHGGALDERTALSPSSPYAHSKRMVEQILRDAAMSGALRAIALRYFNPIGADPAGRTGSQALNPSHALGMLMLAHARGEPFIVTGTDWPTRDGSGVRDFIHVWDLARAHVRALQRFDRVTEAESFVPINLGGGTGTTVRELIAAFEEVTGVTLEVRDGERRPGDVAGAFADSSLAAELLGWHAELGIQDGILDALAWRERSARGGRQ